MDVANKIVSKMTPYEAINSIMFEIGPIEVRNLMKNKQILDCGTLLRKKNTTLTYKYVFIV